MADMNCCHHCQRRFVGCAINCKDWAERQKVIEGIRAERKLEVMLDDHERLAYQNFKRDRRGSKWRDRR